MVQRQDSACTQFFSGFFQIAQMLNRGHRKRQLHDRAEGGFCRSAACNDQLVMLVGTGT